ncbi:MAG: Grx4 family monothiol glutaredoxin [Trichodesmium sp. St16_bin4-tuft]|nr:Grx4 family monothiol glutaredoxin [Trichodesmium sp. St4_bin8_1]MDE5072530.1 Grx4 family monothiol glutaredoxin [Trichodesmium sp. St5_bin8]MDE5078079.1 Grx4 family monothiol glutaredoxin [Trichodesmium sp. St2_bin6]MDE5092632.1 Grx4 family monothiol glutaredoxin [Trichodesmium sp. St18_bin3_1_1]MDE5101124.1 Grx4 family monothiol glutaredoxin [Trichodesmium sp. St16_bin4-tuft]MDE5104480.1 Grx4 family monothiol glutaredoxin [Trichodesmium sp. St19_bin2]
MTLTPKLKAKIDDLVTKNKIMVFMKGNKLMPQCGFSNNVVQILNILGVTYETCDVLEDQDIRQGIKDYSNWPTIPQVYVDGEFLGGSDVMIEMYNNKKEELEQKLAVASAS